MKNRILSLAYQRDPAPSARCYVLQLQNGGERGKEERGNSWKKDLLRVHSEQLGDFWWSPFVTHWTDDLSSPAPQVKITYVALLLLFFTLFFSLSSLQYMFLYYVTYVIYPMWYTLYGIVRGWRSWFRDRMLLPVCPLVIRRKSPLRSARFRPYPVFVCCHPLRESRRSEQYRQQQCSFFLLLKKKKKEMDQRVFQVEEGWGC